MIKQYKHGKIFVEDDENMDQGSFYWKDAFGRCRGEGFCTIEDCMADIDEDQRQTDEFMAIR